MYREKRQQDEACRGTEREREREISIILLQLFLDTNVAINILLLYYYRYIIIVIITLLFSRARSSRIDNLIAACHFRYPNEHCDYATITTSVTSD